MTVRALHLGLEDSAGERADCCVHRQVSEASSNNADPVHSLLCCI